MPVGNHSEIGSTEVAVINKETVKSVEEDEVNSSYPSISKGTAVDLGPSVSYLDVLVVKNDLRDEVRDSNDV